MYVWPTSQLGAVALSTMAMRSTSALALIVSVTLADVVTAAPPAMSTLPPGATRSSVVTSLACDVLPAASLKHATTTFAPSLALSGTETVPLAATYADVDAQSSAPSATATNAVSPAGNVSDALIVVVVEKSATFTITGDGAARSSAMLSVTMVVLP